MQKGLFAWLLFAAYILVFNSLSAQVTIPTPAVEVFVEFKSDSVAFNPEDSLANYANDSIAVTLFVSLPNVTISKIHVKAGGTENGTDIVDKAFIYDGGLNQGGGTTYRRTGQQLYLGLGNFVGIPEVHAEVWLEDGDGNLSQVMNAFLGNR